MPPCYMIVDGERLRSNINNTIGLNDIGLEHYNDNLATRPYIIIGCIQIFSIFKVAAYTIINN